MEDCTECCEAGADYYVDGNGELVCRCPDCSANSDNREDEWE